MNNAAVNICVQVCALTYVFISLTHMPKCMIAESNKTPFLTFLGTVRLLSEVFGPVYIPTSSV